MNTKTLSLALAGAKQAYSMYDEYRAKKQVELYDTIQEAKKLAAERNAEAKKRATAFAEDAREVAAEKRDAVAQKRQALLDDGLKKSKEAKKKASKQSCKAKKQARKDAKQLRKDAAKTRKDLEAKAQKAVDRVSGKEAEREKSGRLATATLVFVFVSALIAALVWKLRKDEKLPVDPTPVKQKATEVKSAVSKKAADVKETAAAKAADAKAARAEKKAANADKVADADKAAEAQVTDEDVNVSESEAAEAAEPTVIADADAPVAPETPETDAPGTDAGDKVLNDKADDAVVNEVSSQAEVSPSVVQPPKPGSAAAAKKPKAPKPVQVKKPKPGSNK
ncbi:hypothetical protein [Corynebacterium sp. H113]|uniref:hypothetical protein n=1 Tax=Corynebacterium sp. H113 TaxID=3133419 RepID=UPI0030B1935C